MVKLTCWVTTVFLFASGVFAQEIVQLVEQTNSARVNSGLAPLLVDVDLCISAQRHAQWMARVHSLTHSGGNYGENIARGYGVGLPGVRNVIRGWLNSVGHRRNMLNPNYRTLGVGYAVDSNGQDWWVQQFSSTGVTKTTYVTPKQLTPQSPILRKTSSRGIFQRILRWRRK